MQDDPLDTISVAPPEPADDEKAATPEVRDAHDAEHDRRLARDPEHADAKLEVGLDESFPSSDPPAATNPGSADPAPSSGYDEDAERRLAEEKSA